MIVLASLKTVLLATANRSPISDKDTCFPQITQCHQDSFLNYYQRCITSLAPLDRVVRSDCVDKDPICALHHPVQPNETNLDKEST
ncbi:unnamed protein product [Lasius platythorax]|uniref:Uncharacterized protein n=1 Tax=Lasius platythorax TaxID=488582 RepID=A0AAV2MZ11_9HYME